MSRPPRILFFTVQKAASMFLFEIARDLSALGKIPFYSPHDGGIRFAHEDMLDPANWAGVTAGCVSPIRQFVDLPDLDQDRVLLHLRDPRDVLTSLYYSMAYSHRLEGSLTADRRARWLDKGIDACMIEDFDGVPAFIAFRDRYREYLDRLAGRPNVTLLRYEDMVTDLAGWLRPVIAAFDVADEEMVLAHLLAIHRRAFDVGAEDVSRHKRQVVPGDHRRRLKPETVEFLTEQFADILRELRYDSPAAPRGGRYD